LPYHSHQLNSKTSICSVQLIPLNVNKDHDVSGMLECQDNVTYMDKGGDAGKVFT